MSCQFQFKTTYLYKLEHSTGLTRQIRTVPDLLIPFAYLKCDKPCNALKNTMSVCPDVSYLFKKFTLLFNCAKNTSIDPALLAVCRDQIQNSAR